MARAWTLLLGLLAGCSLGSDLVECPGERLCPSDTVCDAVHDTCITPEQATACDSLIDGERCDANAAHGYCLDSVCIIPGCGNHVVDEGERCDDGNRVDGDGCSAGCDSREVCGDGALDPSRGEECDDGNAISRDGCDSRCVVETAVWTRQDLGPSVVVREHVTYDRRHQRTVLVSDGFVWAWDGSRWSVIDTQAPVPGTYYSVGFDPDRNRLVVIGGNDQSGSDPPDPQPPYGRMWEWDGSTWTAGSTAAPAPRFAYAEVAYEPVRHAFVVVGDGSGQLTAVELDPVTRTWTSLPPLNVTATFVAAAFDEARGRLVVNIPSASTPIVAEWTPGATTWVQTPTAVSDGSSWSLVYDPVAGQVVAVGGAGTSSGTTAVRAWTGMGWTALPALAGTRTRPAIAFDRARNVRVVVGEDTVAYDQVSEWNGASWTTLPRQALPAGVDDACAFDSIGARLVCIGSPMYPSGDSATWTWDGTAWRDLGTSLGTSSALAFDPVRGRIVAWKDGTLWALVDDVWQMTAVPSNNTFTFAVGLTFDPAGRRLVITQGPTLVRPSQTSLVYPDDTRVGFNSIYVTRLAFDARDGVVRGFSTDGVQQLVANTWTAAVGPGIGYRGVENQRRGSIEYFGMGLAPVEKRGTEWTTQATLPPVSLQARPVYDPKTGDLYLIGNNGYSRFMLRREYTSATPLESCGPGEDADGDGLAGCADPDCFTTCTPSCPPYATCP